MVITIVQVYQNLTLDVPVDGEVCVIHELRSTPNPLAMAYREYAAYKAQKRGCHVVKSMSAAMKEISKHTTWNFLFDWEGELLTTPTEKKYRKFTPWLNVQSKSVKVRTHKPKLIHLPYITQCKLSGKPPKDPSSAIRWRPKETNALEVEFRSGVSKYVAAGLVNVRDTYHKLDPLGQRGLRWRDFYYQLSYITYDMKKFKPVFLDLSQSLQPKFDKFKWDPDQRKYLAKWVAGKTGFPIIDAAMRQIAATGEMSNRLRMVVSNFLIKIYRVDWRLGAEYFAAKLIDFDYILNMQNWQWSASCGVDAQPWFRMFNPKLQHYKFDKRSTYVRKWVPNDPDNYINIEFYSVRKLETYNLLSKL